MDRLDYLAIFSFIAIGLVLSVFLLIQSTIYGKMATLVKTLLQLVSGANKSSKMVAIKS